MVLKSIFPCLIALLLMGIVKAAAADEQLLQAKQITLKNGQRYDFRTYGGQNVLPKLTIKNLSNDQTQIIQWGAEDRAAFYYQSVLYFKSYSLKKFPSPLIIAVAAAPGGSETLFVTKLLDVENGRAKVLNGAGWKTLIEGGLDIGHLTVNKKICDVLIWNPVLGNQEAHQDPHHYAISCYQWNNKKFYKVNEWLTKNKFYSFYEVLQEFHLQVTDRIAEDFPIFQQYR
jgi:hypothetical protein